MRLLIAKKKLHQQTWFKLTLLCFALFTVTNVVFTKYVFAHHTLPDVGCAISEVRDSSVGANPQNGTGFVYQTLNIQGSSDSNQKGGTVRASCVLTRANYLTFKGMFADAAWLGTEAGNAFPGGFTPRGCLATPPTPNGTQGVSGAPSGCDNTGKWEVFQDDAGAVAVNGTMIHCQGMSGFCNNGGDVYRYGVENTSNVGNHNCAWTTVGGNCFNDNLGDGLTPIRGAGYFDLAQSPPLTPYLTSSDGALNSIPIQMWFRNTWTGGYATAINITLRFRQRSAVCAAGNNAVRNVAPGVSGSTPLEFTNNGQETWRSGFSRPEDPRGSSNSYVAARVTGANWAIDEKGLPFSPIARGQTGRFTISYTAPSTPGTYYFEYQMHVRLNGTLLAFGEKCNFTLIVGNPGNFNFTPDVDLVANDPELENVTQVTFYAGIDSNAEVDATAANPITVTRRYEVIKYGGATTPTVLPPSSTGNVHPGRALEDHNPGGGGREFSAETRSFSGLVAGDKICTYLRISPTSGTVNTTTNDIISSSGTLDATPACITIVDKPYVKFHGGDVYAGGGFVGGSCDKQSGIHTYFNTNYTGSSAQFAAFALGQINEFTTANLGTGAGIAKAPADLTFSNREAINLPAYATNSGFNSTAKPYDLGGSFGSFDCYHNYLADAGQNPDGSINGNNVAAPNRGSAASFSINPGADGAYFNTPGGTSGGILTLSPPSTIATGKHIILYVDGSIYINQNITYNTDCGTNWCNETSIPFFQVVTSGNIYISPSVTRLDGIYIAQKRADNNDDNGGNIYTCATSTGPYDLSSSPSPLLPPSGACSQNTLTVFGTFIANKVWLWRTKYSLRDSASIKAGGSLESSLLAGLGSAETFVFSPEIYASNMCISLPSYCASTTQVDKFFSLPPIL